MDANWRELLLAAQDSVQADCRRHRDRAQLRLGNALLSVRTCEHADPREDLLRRLADYAAEFSEDPEAERLVGEARELGVIPL